MTPKCPNSFSYFATPDFLQLVYHVIGTIELPLHLLGAYCILTKTPKRMKHVKVSLLTLHLLTVIFGVIVGFLIMPYVTLPVLGGISLGILSVINVPGSLQLYIWYTSIGSAAVGILGVFENRYYHLSNNLEWKKYRKYCMAFNYFCAISFYIYPIAIIPDQELSRAAALETLPCLVNLPNFDINTMYVLSLDPTLSIVLILVMENLVASQTGLFVIVTTRKMMELRHHLSKSTYDMQKKFLIALIVQFAIYLLVFGIPLLLVLNSLIVGSFNQVVNNCIYITFSSYGFISIISMLWFHKPYRDWLMGKMRVHSPSVSKVSNLHVPVAF